MIKTLIKIAVVVLAVIGLFAWLGSDDTADASDTERCAIVIGSTPVTVNCDTETAKLPGFVRLTEAVAATTDFSDSIFADGDRCYVQDENNIFNEVACLHEYAGVYRLWVLRDGELIKIGNGDYNFGYAEPYNTIAIPQTVRPNPQPSTALLPHVNSTTGTTVAFTG